MSTESVSSDSPLQVPQLIEDQLSEEELETLAGGIGSDAIGSDAIGGCYSIVPPGKPGVGVAGNLTS
jgi:hypothetical protein